MTTLTDRLDFPNVQKTILVNIAAGEHLKFWTVSAGQTYTYECATTNRVTAVRENGAALTSRASIALVEANAGSYFWNQAAGKVHVHPTGSVSPYTKTLQALVKFTFSTRSGIWDGLFYDGRISSLPDLTMSVEPRFGDAARLGAGTLKLRNEDGELTAHAALQWDAGTVSLLFGADGPYITSPTDRSLLDGFETDESSDGFISDVEAAHGFRSAAGTVTVGHLACEYADFDQIASFRVTRWEFSNEEVIFQLEEPKSSIKKKIPLPLFTFTAYPNMEQGLDGEVIPAAYGRIYGAEAKVIDIALRKFKVTNHAIKGFLCCYVERLIDGTEKAVPIPVAFATSDPANGEFTLSAADWGGRERVLVDFEGRMNADGTLMQNAADIVQSILTDLLSLPVASLDAGAFAASAALLEIGTDRYGNPAPVMRPSVFLDEEEEADEVIAAICEFVGAYFIAGYDGLHRFIAFTPSVGEGLTTFEYPETLFSVEEESDATGIISFAKAKYRMAAGDDQVDPWIATHERVATQYLRGATSHIVAEREIATSEARDASHYAQRTTRQEGVPLRLLTVEVDHRAWTKRPGDQVRIVHSELDIDGTFEVIEVKRSLNDMSSVRLLLGDLHGHRDEVGFWVADSPTFPARLGGGSCAAWDVDWTAAQKAWAKANIGFWTDDNGYAAAADPDSFMPSAWV